MHFLDLLNVNEVKGAQVALDIQSKKIFTQYQLQTKKNVAYVSTRAWGRLEHLVETQAKFCLGLKLVLRENFLLC